jgi:hypothetical protein
MLVRAAGIEPARLTAADFKSDASTNFAMPASARIVLRPANVVLANEHGGNMPARRTARIQGALHINNATNYSDLRCRSGSGARGNSVTFCTHHSTIIQMVESRGGAYRTVGATKNPRRPEPAYALNGRNAEITKRQDEKKPLRCTKRSGNSSRLQTGRLASVFWNIRFLRRRGFCPMRSRL